MKGAALLLGAVCELASFGVARAETSAVAEEEIVIVPSTCAQPSWVGLAWAELLRVELTATGQFNQVTVQNGAELSSRSPWRVSIDLQDCSASASFATLTIRNRDRPQTRTVDLSQVKPIARARVLAIAAAELVRSEVLAAASPVTNGRSTDAQTPRPDIALHRTMLIEKVPSAASVPANARQAVLFASGEARAFVQGNAGLFGGRAGLLLPIQKWLLFAADAGALFGNARDPLGNVRSSLASVGIGLLGVGGAGHAWLGFGPRLETGLASFQGQPYLPTTASHGVSSPVVLFSLTTTVCVPIAGSASGFAAFDVGTSLYGFGSRADDHLVSNFEGTLGSARVGLALDLAAR